MDIKTYKQANEIQEKLIIVRKLLNKLELNQDIDSIYSGECLMMKKALLLLEQKLEEEFASFG